MNDNCRKKYYYGYSICEDIILSASGGAALELYRCTIEKHGIVYGVRWSEDYHYAHYTRIESQDNLYLLQGSKYIKASLNLEDGRSLYQAVLDDVVSGREVMVVGLPCEIYGLFCFLESKDIRKSDNLTTIDVICHGPGQGRVHESYITYMEKKYKARTVSLNMRYKNPNWGKSYLKITFDNDKEYIQELYKTQLGIANNFMGALCGFNCRFKGDNRKSDMTIGDYWGGSPDDENYNAKGMSLLIVNSEKGYKELMDLRNFHTYEILSKEKALEGNPYYWNSREKPKEYNVFSKLYLKYGLAIACFICLGFKRLIGYYFPTLYTLLKFLRRKEGGGYEKDKTRSIL